MLSLHMDPPGQVPTNTVPVPVHSGAQPLEAFAGIARLPHPSYLQRPADGLQVTPMVSSTPCS
jgi:hypothetical protein